MSKYYYKIAESIICSDIFLPSYQDFSTDATQAEFFISETAVPLPSNDPELIIQAGDMTVRKYGDKWHFCSNHDPEKRLVVNKDYTHTYSIGLEITQLEALIRFAFECHLIPKGIITLHSSTVELNGKAIAFTGPSGTGKSTRAQLCIDAENASLISGDRPLINVATQTVYGAPWDGKERCFRNVAYPLQAICEVRRCEDTRLRDLSVSQRIALLSRQCFMPMWDTELAAMQLFNLRNLASSAVILRAFCDRTAASVRETIASLRTPDAVLPAADDIAVSDKHCRKSSKDGSLVLVPASIQNAHQALLLNSTAEFIYTQLCQSLCLDDLLFSIVSSYDVSPETARVHLAQLLQQLIDLRLLRD